MLSVQVGEYSIYYHNQKEVRGLVREIFRDSVYYFETEKRSPIILDIGAHIGMATLYFKKLYPDAKVFAVEPNPASLDLLKTNIQVNHLEDVMVIPAAVSEAGGSTQFYADETADHWHSTDSFNPQTWDGVGERKQVLVDAVTLNDLVHTQIDLVKMDVEGAEQSILMSSAQVLPQIKQLIFEYHPIPGNNLHELARFLKELGFQISCYKHRQEIPLFKAKGLVLVEAISEVP